jgi:hypothetical protein
MARPASSASRLTKTPLPSGRVYRLERRRSHKSLMQRLRAIWRVR